MRNVRIAYLLTFIKNSYFWLGTWIFFYLSYTDYAGVGLIESIVFTLISLSEIPTGALSDLWGRKWVISLGLFLEGTAGFMMAFAPSLNFLLLSLPFLALGGALYSGTLEALVYDSLKEEGGEDKYEEVISRISTIQLVAFSICTIIGGWLYLKWIGLPYLLVGIFYFVGAGIALMIKEPVIDSIKFSWPNYVLQIKQGFKQLFTKKVTYLNCLLVIVAAVFYVLYQSLNDILGVEFGFDPLEWSIVMTIVFIVSAFGSAMTERMTGLIGRKMFYSFAVGIVIITLLLSPKISLVAGGISVVVRFVFTTMAGNIASVWVNKNTESKYRATTLSTFNLIAHLPYGIMAYFLGTVMQALSGKLFAFWLGIILLPVVMLMWWSRDSDQSEN